MMCTILCKLSHPLHADTLATYEVNLVLLAAEDAAVVAQVESCKHVLAALLSLHSKIHDRLIEQLELVQIYEVVRTGAKGVGDEPYSDEGDLDGDGISNFEEFEIILLDGGTPDDFGDTAGDAAVVGPQVPAVNWWTLSLLALTLCGLGFLALQSWADTRSSEN